MKILIVEDQENIAKLIKDGLESEGFVAEYVLDGQAAQEKIDFNHDDYSLILCDIMLPKKSGLELCISCRENNINTPIIMLTAKDSHDDIIDGFNAGADDYLVKPFLLEVLIARIRAILRRPTTPDTEILNFKNIQLDTGKKNVLIDEKDAKLTIKEFALLEYLMRNPKQIVNREQIISNIWDISAESASNIVDVHITNLRKKIDDDKNQIIETVRGLGYRLKN